MLNFLKQTRKLLNSTDSICIVIGNESCDLDSAVCALTLAYFYEQRQHQERESTKPIKKDLEKFLPVLNIPRRDYALKTEVRYLFDKFSISEENLTFRDELKEDFIKRNNIILVDHHVSPFAERCVEVFDHRSFDDSANLPSNCKIIMELVGSCSTLVADLILKQHVAREEICSTTMSLLHSAIVLDTVNFSIAAARHTPKDIQICDDLENILATTGAKVEQREQIFKSLVAARASVSSLSALQLLRKDLKILTNTNNNIKIAIPGFPISVQHFIEKPDAVEAVQQFAKEMGCAIVLLMGMVVNDNGNVQRDIGLIDVNEGSNLCNVVLEVLSKSDNPVLCLQKSDNINFMQGNFFKQNNVKVTRKQVLPIVKKILDQW